MGLIDRFQRSGWNVFRNREPTYNYIDIGAGYSQNPVRPRVSKGKERSIVTSIILRMALDVASMDITHCKLDENGEYKEDMKNSLLNERLKVEANIDQTGRAFLLDMALTLLDEGCIAVVPVDTDTDPDESSGYKILSMRVGKIVEWRPRHVKVEIYDDEVGERKQVLVHKRDVAIIENPFYSVMNETNSTMQRLIRKLNLLDIIDEQSGSGKLDIIIQLPYTVKGDHQKQRAEDRRKSIEEQLTGSKYGIAYADATERITQLNRPVENNLMKQIEYLTNMVYSQLGITQSIMDGTADEGTMLNYYSRTIEPIIAAIVDELKRKFLTKTARTQGQTIMYFRDPFKLVPIANIADIADKFTRNEILSSNEVRSIIGRKPSSDPKADKLINSNLNHPEETESAANEPEEPDTPEDEQEMEE